MQGLVVRVVGLGLRRHHLVLVPCVAFRVQGSGFRVQGSRFRVTLCRVQCFGVQCFGVQGLRLSFGVQGLRFRVQG